MSELSFDELKAAVSKAGRNEDVVSLERYAQELEALEGIEAQALAAMARGSAERINGDPRTSREHYHRSLLLYSTLGDKKKMAVLNGNISANENLSGNHTVALEYAHRALKLHQELGDSAGMANNYNHIGSVYYATGDLSRALEYRQRVLTLRETLGDTKGIATAITNIGNVYDGIGNYPQALENFHRALAIMEDLGDRKEVARILGNIGVVYENTGNYSLSLKYKQRAHDLLVELNYRIGLAFITGSTGTLFVRMGRYSEALEYFRRSLALYEEYGQREAVARYTGNIISVLIQLGSFDEAERMLDVFEAEKIAHPTTLFDRLSSRARIQIHNGQLDLAMETLLRSLQHAQAFVTPASEAAARSNLRDLCQQRNDFAGYIEHNNEYSRIIEAINGKDTASKLAIMETEAKMAKERAEHEKHLSILHSTLPKTIADRVARGETVNDHYDNAAVIFLDIVGFTAISDQLSSGQVVNLLDQIFTTLDAVCANHDVVKIKTIGDSYLAVAFPNESPNVEQRAAQAALEMIAALTQITTPTGAPLEARLGIHCGPLTAGVIGTTRLQYDVWGDTVNVASRMESTSEPGRIHISESLAKALGEAHIVPRGPLEIRGKGMMNTYWLRSTSP